MLTPPPLHRLQIFNRSLGARSLLICVVSCMGSLACTRSAPQTAAVPAEWEPIVRVETVDTGAITLPAPAGFVTDAAGVLSKETTTAVERMIQELDAAIKGQIAVVILPSLHGHYPLRVAQQIGEQWGVGHAGKDEDSTANTGVVILLAPAEKEIRIVADRNAASFLSSATIGRIIEEVMVPHFKRRNYDSAVHCGVSAVLDAFVARFNLQLQSPRPRCTVDSTAGKHD